MHIMREMRKRAHHVLPGVFFAAVVGYFTYHAVQGDKGLYSYLKRNKELTVARAELEELQAEKAEIERRVRGLRHTSLDLDLLEERVRAVLNLMRDDELLIQFKRD